MSAKNKIVFNAQFSFELSLSNLSQENNLDKLAFGWELAHGRLCFSKLDEWLPDHRISFFPIIENSIPFFLLLKSLEENFSYFSKEFKSICFFNLPEELEKQSLVIAQSYPQSLLLAQTKTIAAGTYMDSKSNPAAALEKDPLIFFESVDAKRFILHQLKEAKLHFIDSPYATLQYDFLRRIQDGNNLQECLLNSGIIPWLQALFLIKTTQKDTITENLKRIFFSSQLRFLQLLQKNKNKNIFVAMDIENLLDFADFLDSFMNQSEFLEIGRTSLTQLRTLKEKKIWGMAKFSGSSLIEYARVTGFLSNSFCTDLNCGKESYELSLKKALTKAFINVCNRYNEWTCLKISASQERDFFKFIYRLAADKGRLFPNSLDILLAAQAIVDSNFAYEFHKECQNFPTHLKYENTLAELSVPLTSFYANIDKISLKRFETVQTQKRAKKTSPKLFYKKKETKKTDLVSEEKYQDNLWVKEDSPYSCSFPEEDIFMESLAAHIKTQIKEKVRAQNIILRDLESDFCDGIDIRETIRNWYCNKIIVKDLLISERSDIGAVVFGFVSMQEEASYSWRSFWLAEQHDDSHLMFFATPFQDKLIGPGVAKSEFGGFAVLPLDSYIEQPWYHSYITQHAKSSMEALILTGALSNAHKSVLFVSNHPPSSHIVRTLKQSAKTIIYVHLNEFSQEDIRRVRTFHILAEAGVRNYAQKYIRKD